MNSGVVLLSSGDNFLAGPEFNASLTRPPGEPIYDAVGYDLIRYDAFAIGNHEFDFGPDILERFITSFSVNQTPFLSSNLDYSGEPGLAALETAGRLAKCLNDTTMTSTNSTPCCSARQRCAFTT